MAELRETIERILDGHRKGFKDRLQTVELLERVHSGQDPNGRFELCDCLAEAMRTNPLRSNPVEGIPANIPVVALIALAKFGTTENLPALVLSLAPWADASRLGEWADEIYPLLRQCLFDYADRFDDRAFVYLRGYCDSVRRSQQAFPLSFVKAIQELERVVERVEFERFEHTLRQARRLRNLHLYLNKDCNAGWSEPTNPSHCVPGRSKSKPLPQMSQPAGARLRFIYDEW